MLDSGTSTHFGGSTPDWPLAAAGLLSMDVLIPTLDRAPMLERAVRSLLDARVPAGLHILITVINNRCTDNTSQVVAALAARYPGRVRMITERRRGKSRALNAGLAATTGALVGMIDDDEEVAADWFVEACRAFQDPSVDFVGGPYIPVWDVKPPSWVPSEYLAVLGAVDNGGEPRDYGWDFSGILKGGNAVIRRSVLQRVGPYAEYLGPAGHGRLLSCEDEDMYQRLLKHGARGRYLPSLVIFHHVAAERLTPQYYRSWCFWRGVSRGLMDPAHKLPVPYLAGVPRFLVGRAALGVVRMAADRMWGVPWQRSFADELSVWDLAGYAWGRHVYTLARFSPVKSRRSGHEGATAGE